MPIFEFAVHAGRTPEETTKIPLAISHVCPNARAVVGECFVGRTGKILGTVRRIPAPLKDPASLPNV